jgi:hypothetical protein
MEHTELCLGLVCSLRHVLGAHSSELLERPVDVFDAYSEIRVTA